MPDDFLDGIAETAEAEETAGAEEVREETPAETPETTETTETSGAEEPGQEEPSEAPKEAPPQTKPDPVLKTVQDFAAANGMTQDQLLGWMQQNQKTIVVNNKLAQLQAKYPEADAGMLNEMAQVMAEKEIAESNTRARENEERIARERNEPWVKFFRQFPMDVKSIPKEVFEGVGQGLTPVEAYQSYRIKQLEAASTAAKQNQKNKEKALGSVQGQGGEQPTDPFLEGLSE